MVNPVPGYSITTAYGISGSHWTTCGYHTGVDYACPKGTSIVAAIAGQIRHRNYGSSFGNHQFAISPDPGQPYSDGEIFYAHTSNRLNDGVYVAIGDIIANVGTEGNVTGPHLHFEYHPQSKNIWNCSAIANPQPVIDHTGNGNGYPPPNSKTVYLSKLHYGQEASDSVWYLQSALNGHPMDGGYQIQLTGNYFSDTDWNVRKCQQLHGFGNDPALQSFVGPSQAEHLFAGKGLTVIY